jgi:hypothetical protein
VFCSVAAYGADQNQYYAGTENPLVKLGTQRVMKTINYPDWFQYPGIPADVRQKVVDSYTTREFLVAFDQADKTTPALVTSLLQTFIDFAGSFGGTSQIVPYTTREANRDLKAKVIPTLVKPREGYELDSSSGSEAGYDGQNGGEIKLLDLEMGRVRRQYVPPDLRPDPNYRPTTIGPAPQTTIGPARPQPHTTIGPAPTLPTDQSSKAQCEERNRQTIAQSCSDYCYTKTLSNGTLYKSMALILTGSMEACARLRCPATKLEKCPSE